MHSLWLSVTVKPSNSLLPTMPRALHPALTCGAVARRFVSAMAIRCFHAFGSGIEFASGIEKTVSAARCL